MMTRIKSLLGLADNTQDEKLRTILELTKARLIAMLGVPEVPSEMEYIAVETTVKRFNRIGSEGMTSHEVEGEAIQFSTNDFTEYMSDIEDWRAEHKSKRGRIRFL